MMLQTYSFFAAHATGARAYQSRGLAMSDQPGYTRLPNHIIEAMPLLGNGELRVLLAIARKTIGYQKESDRISVSQIEKLTGLTSRNTQKAIVSLLERGFIDRQQVGKQAYEYSVKPCPVGTQLGNHVPSDPISPRDTEPHPLGTRLEGKPYPLGTTQKKDFKEKKERVGAGAKRAPRTPRKKEPKDATPLPVIQSLADVCKIDRDLATKQDHIILAEAAGALYRAGLKHGKTDDEIIAAISHFGRWYARNDFRGQKGEAPTPALVRRLWPQAIEAKHNGVVPPTVAAARQPQVQAAQPSRRAVLAERAKMHGK